MDRTATETPDLERARLAFFTDDGLGSGPAVCIRRFRATFHDDSMNRRDFLPLGSDPGNGMNCYQATTDLAWMTQNA